MFVIASVFSAALMLSPQEVPDGQAQPAGPGRSADPAAEVTPLPPVNVTRQAASGEDPNREVCRRVQSTVGTNRPRRICAPAWQWAQAREDGRNHVLRETPGTQGPVIGGMGEPPPGRGF